MMWRVAILYSIIAIVAAAALLAAFLFWGYATWPLGDTEAFGLSPGGWVKHSLFRAGASCVGGLLLAVLAFILLRFTKFIVGIPLSGKEARLCALTAALPTAFGLAGSVQFAVTRPFI